MKKTKIFILLILIAFLFVNIAMAAAQYRVGDKVMVKWQGKWYPANIIAKKSATVYRIHYLGWNSSFDEDVSIKNIKPYVATNASWKVGDKVMVKWGSQWWKAVILEVRKDGYKVHYEGYDAKWDEVVASSRIKAR